MTNERKQVPEQQRLMQQTVHWFTVNAAAVDVNNVQLCSAEESKKCYKSVNNP